MLFLDEPTTGLDPRSRNDLWEHAARPRARRHHLILTTQYLEEADRLADDIVVLDHGRTVAHGTPDELKAQIGDDRIDVTVAAPSELVAAAGCARRASSSDDPTIDERPARRHRRRSPTDTRLIDVVRALDDAGIDAVDLNRRQATLDDVFLTLTASTPEPSRSRRCPHDRHAVTPAASATATPPPRTTRTTAWRLVAATRWCSPAATSSTSARSPRSCSTSRSSR